VVNFARCDIGDSGGVSIGDKTGMLGLHVLICTGTACRLRLVLLLPKASSITLLFKSLTSLITLSQEAATIGKRYLKKSLNK
jgi:hypothetical protein